MFDHLQPSPGQNTCLLLMVVKLVSVLPSHWDRTCEKMPRGIKMIVIAISHKCWLVETLIPESCVNKHKRFLETGRVNDHERTDEANFHDDFNGVQGRREQPNQCPKQKIVSSILRDLIFRKITEEEHHYRDSPLYLSSSRLEQRISKCMRSRLQQCMQQVSSWHHLVTILSKPSGRYTGASRAVGPWPPPKAQQVPASSPALVQAGPL